MSSRDSPGRVKRGSGSSGHPGRGAAPGGQQYPEGLHPPEVGTSPTACDAALRDGATPAAAARLESGGDGAPRRAVPPSRRIIPPTSPAAGAERSPGGQAAHFWPPRPGSRAGLPGRRHGRHGPHVTRSMVKAKRHIVQLVVDPDGKYSEDVD